MCISNFPSYKKIKKIKETKKILLTPIVPKVKISKTKPAKKAAIKTMGFRKIIAKLTKTAITKGAVVAESCRINATISINIKKNLSTYCPPKTIKTTSSFEKSTRLLTFPL